MSDQGVTKEHDTFGKQPMRSSIGLSHGVSSKVAGNVISRSSEVRLLKDKVKNLALKWKKTGNH